MAKVMEKARKVVTTVELRVPAVSVRQDGTTLYISGVRSGDLLPRFKVDEWRKLPDGSESGYQRRPEGSRTAKVARYLKSAQRRLLPTAVLINIRREDMARVRWEPLEEGSPLGFLVIPAGVVLWVVDGQHRTYGIREAIDDGVDLIDFELPAVFMMGLKVEEEADQFRIVNETAKKVRTDLARRLLVQHAREFGRVSIVRMDRVWEADAAEVIDRLNSMSSSPWKGRIQVPNERKGKTHAIKELSFSTSLKPVLTERPMKDARPDRVAEVLLGYWSAWRDLVPDAFSNPEQYVLLKTPGVFSLHEVARYVFRFCDHHNIPLEQAEFQRILETLDDYTNPEFWKKGSVKGGETTAEVFGSMKGFRQLADLMITALQEKGIEF